MSRILVAYASTHGHTGKVAAHVAAAARDAGATVELLDLAGLAHAEPTEYDAIVLGGSIHAGKHQRELVEWATAHNAALNALPSAFFTVCLTAAEDSVESRDATAEYIEHFVRASGWTPAITATFAGALQYREYDFMTRLLVRLLMRSRGRPTDANRDYEYTDWDAAADFGRACAALAAEPAGRPGR
jgi:menaquinone-dependent protoporphyrinogen oxidase